MASMAVLLGFRYTCGGLTVFPPSMLVVRKVATRAFEASKRASYHVITRVPVTGSTASCGMNWERSPSEKPSAAESLLMRRGSPPLGPDHVWPPSVDLIK